MPQVRVSGLQNTLSFPDEMSPDDILAVLRQKFAQQAIEGTQSIDLQLPGDTKGREFNRREQSLSEKIAAGVASSLTESGIISDNFRAQQIGQNVSAIADFIPGIGDATGGSEVGLAAARGDTLGVGLGMLGAIPIAGDFAKKAVKALKFNVTGTRGGGVRIDSDNGKIFANAEGDSFVIGGALIKDEAKRGKGEGKQLYLATIEEAKKRNLKTLASDESVTPDAARVWESLKKDGFPVVKNKGARFIDDKTGGFWGVDDDLPVYTMDIRNLNQ